MPNLTEATGENRVKETWEIVQRFAEHEDCLNCRCEPHQRCAGTTVVSRPLRGAQ